MGMVFKNPPMGWNSYDYYDTTVNEEQVKANADFMAKHLKVHTSAPFLEKGTTGDT